MKILVQLIDRSRWPLYLAIFLISCAGSTDYDTSFTWSPVEINGDLVASPEIEAIIAPYRIQLDSQMNEVIGYASHDLTTEGKYESTLGLFVTRLLREQSIASYGREVDVAIMNHHGGLRAPINEGPITLGEVYEVMPFENEMILLEVPGDSMVQVIQHIGKSGRSMIWPVSFQVSAAGVVDVLIAGEEVVADKNYVLAISDYLANGGGGFKMLTSLKKLDVNPVKLRDMIVAEIKQWSDKGDSLNIKMTNLITEQE